MTVFGDDRVQEALKDFIPLTQNVHYTQNLRVQNALTDYFWEVLEGVGHDRNQQGTTQGLYVFDASGCAFEWMNARDPERLVAMLGRARAAFEADPPAKLELSGERVIVKPQPPEGGIILRSYSRILPVPEDAHPVNGYVGRDHVWITAGEVEALAGGEFPVALGARLARFHLWDNVRGEPDFWRPNQVERIDFRATAATEGGITRVKIEGEFAMHAPAGARRRSPSLPDTAYAGTLRGEMIYDVARGRVVDFTLFAEGTARGHGVNNPRAPEGDFPLSIAMVLVEDEIAREVPPQALFWGLDNYLDPAIGGSGNASIWD